MAEDEKEMNETLSDGADWEVVSLTASTYQAAPGPITPEEFAEDEVNEGIMETSAAMFMSSHFIFPPNELEGNLKKESECSEIKDEAGIEDVNNAEDKNHTSKDHGEENFKTKSEDSLHGMELLNKDKRLLVDAVEFSAGKTFPGLNLVEELNLESMDQAEDNDIPQNIPESPLDNTNASKLSEENKCVKSGLPSEAWWRRRAAYLYNHAKDANSFWSFVVAAALLGFVIVGQQCQRDKLQLQQLKWQFNFGEERMNWTFRPFTRFKDVFIGNNQAVPLAKVSLFPSV